jgi:glycosyltransferase involved in cell wall biosynthesis
MMPDAVVPRVTICIPVYNGARYIKEAVESILAQTYRSFEILIGDNCSTDDTAAIVSQFVDPRVRYERNERNLGPVGNVNRCLERASGEYVGILHHDDVMLPENLERKVRVLDTHPEIGFVHSNMMLIDSGGAVVRPHSWSEDARGDSVERGIIAFRRMLDRAHFGSTIFIGTVLARRTCYEQLGGFRAELRHCNDSEMWMRMLLFQDVACLGEPLVKYRVHPMSASSAFGDYASISYLREHYAAVGMVFEKYRERIPEADALKTRVSRAFADRALGLAARAFHDGDAEMGRECMREASRMMPGVWRRASFWRAKAHRLAGPRVMRWLRETRECVAGGK